MEEWRAEWIEGQRTFYEMSGEREVSVEEVEILAKLVPMLREINSVDELREHYESKRDSIVRIIQRSISSPEKEDVDIGRILKMAYGLRNVEISSGRPLSDIDWQTNLRFDHAVKEALSDMYELAQRFRHQEVNIYHLLWSLLRRPEITQRDFRFAQLLEVVDEYIGALPSPPFDRHRTPGTIGEDIKQVLEAATEEAKQRKVARIRPPLVLYTVLKIHASELRHLLDHVFSVRDLEISLVDMLDKETGSM